MKLSEHQKAQMYAGSQFGADIVKMLDSVESDSIEKLTCSVIETLSEAPIGTDGIFEHFDEFLSELSPATAEKFNALLQEHVNSVEFTNEVIKNAINELSKYDA